MAREREGRTSQEETMVARATSFVCHVAISSTCQQQWNVRWVGGHREGSEELALRERHQLVI